MMSPIQNLHDALGQLAYAVAFADGKVQKQERDKFESIVAAELRCKDYDFDVADIAFKILEKEKLDMKTVYEWAIKEIRMNSHYLSPKLKKTFINVMEKIAKAYPPVTIEEQNLIDKFKLDIAPLEGDPIFYESLLL